jgi:hypothetical protein
MKLLKFPSKPDSDPFFKEIIEEGYHIFNLENAKNPNYYPNDFPDYPGVNLRDLKIGDVVTVRAFFKVGSGKNVRADGGYLDLEIEHIEDDSVFGVIMTELPKGFALQKGTSLELFKDEILYKAEMTEH